MEGGDWKENVIRERLGGKKDWTEAERVELSRQLDQEIEDRFDELIKGTHKGSKKGGGGEKGGTAPEGGGGGEGDAAVNTDDGKWTEENWRDKMAETPIFTPYVGEVGPDGQMTAPDNPLCDGLAQLKFHSDHNTPDELAQNYKTEGIHHFKYKKYRLAIANFTEGLKVKCTDSQLLAQLLNNRAAAYYHLSNFRSATRDCEQAVALVPGYRKAIQRGAESADSLGQWPELIRWCDRGLALDSADKFFVELRRAAVEEQNKCERNIRKRRMDENQRLAVVKQVIAEIEKRGVHLEPRPPSDAAGGGGDDDDDDECSQVDRVLASLPDLEPCHPSAVGSKVHLNKAGELVWPVLLMYPEYQQTDFIQHFNEKHTFLNQLEVVFGEASPPPPWDRHRQYVLHNLSIYYEDRRAGALHLVPLHATLRETLCEPRYMVQAGTPSFIITVTGSKFLRHFLSRYNHKPQPHTTTTATSGKTTKT